VQIFSSPNRTESFFVEKIAFFFYYADQKPSVKGV